MAARVVVVEFSDFQCPYCAAFAADVLPELKAAYMDSGKVRFVFRHLPLTQTHAHAMGAAAAGSCADKRFGKSMTSCSRNCRSRH